ncbi:hypothetical protein GCM10007920_38560 [Ciceribacter naphthalenivorans]|uniref:Uncharacterized protein n=1 Tax=Sphingomonas psychrolutea TaxID=1259676 RepID=A0ABQ6EGP4_9SPHN|nr:hypothetical protein GCM10007920_38560 [Ciceribacter naphthalenivorans]GLT06918.1 hypothetical protein GCM10007926_38560 [Sphingomonas psychrolutea]
MSRDRLPAEDPFKPAGGGQISAKINETAVPTLTGINGRKETSSAEAARSIGLPKSALKVFAFYVLAGVAKCGQPLGQMVSQ